MTANGAPGPGAPAAACARSARRAARSGGPNRDGACRCGSAAATGFAVSGCGGGGGGEAAAARRAGSARASASELADAPLAAALVASGRALRWALVTAASLATAPAPPATSAGGGVRSSAVARTELSPGPADSL